ncbi:MAG TPA: hypothetical protein PKK23_07855 [Nitrospirales bacterium]|nr:hypothetical protein [Nitrospiraceae bacterium]HNP28945.1 hypothetical protein [Nitrospirales bacterium]
MQDQSSVSRKQKGLKGGSPPFNSEFEWNPKAPGEPLDVKIANRAQEITKLRGGSPGGSLASWLEAAREVLSDDSDNLS